MITREILLAAYHFCIIFHLSMAITVRELFGDVEIGQGPIVCPSGNQVYVHPISGDLQQCSQKLGFYNQTTCPGGTVCERFPILVPGFQDYCCWEKDTSENENAIIVSTTELPEELSQFTTDSVDPYTDYTSTYSPETSEESYATTSNVMSSISSGGRKGPFSKKGRKKISQEEQESDEWIQMTTKAPRTRKTRRPRQRKIKTTVPPDPTTTTTTTMKPPPPRRGPRCANPDDAALIDFGNRLRDCYYQQCPFGYRCEFTSEIRRYICCGKERDVFPPPGLPPLPEPMPIVPRPFRPSPGQGGPGPYGGVPGPDAYGNGPGSDIDFTEYRSPDSQKMRLEPECPVGSEHRIHPLQSATFCEPENLNFICPISHPYCVHSKICGAHVCCSNQGTVVKESDSYE